MSKKILSILLVLFTIITAFVTSQAAAPKKLNDTYIVDYGSTVNFLGSQSTIKTNDNSIASVNGNSLKIVGIGHFNVTAVTNGKEENFKFFAWNAYLKNGKYYTYNDEARKSKSDVLYSKTYLALSATKNNNAFKVEDYLFETGKYNGELKGKYLTSYYNSSKDISSTSNIVYSFTDNSTVTEIKLSSYDNNDENKPVDYKINLNKTSLNMNVGDKETLKETVTGGYDGSVTWTSTDTSIVSVEKGIIKAIKSGTATVKATISNGSQASCKVTVKPKKEEKIPVDSIALNKENATIIVPKGKFSSNAYSLKLDVTFSPTNATDKKITWSSSSTSIASVDKDGLVTPKKEGTVTITAKSENGKKATCVVNIKTSTVNIVRSGSTVKIKNAKLISVDNAKIANIENNELKIIGAGTFKAIVETEGKEITLNFFAWNAYLKGGKYYTYNDEARKSKSDVLYSKTYLALSATKEGKSFKVEDYSYETGKYKGELQGKYLTSYYDEKNNRSKTSNYVYAFKKDTTITTIDVLGDVVSVDEGELPTTEPEKIPGKISLNREEISLKVGETYQLIAIILSDNDIYKKATFTTSDSNIATVKDGLVTAINLGTAKISAKTDDGLEAICTVNVISGTSLPVQGFKLNQEQAGRIAAQCAKYLYNNRRDEFAYGGGSHLGEKAYEGIKETRYLAGTSGHYPGNQTKLR